ncbi:MAG: hypothetical protein ACTSVM_04450 [Candidatus Ranarchaeia archaeon]
MMPHIDSSEKFEALRRALHTLSMNKVIVEQLSAEQAVFLAPGLSKEQVKTLIDLIAGWIGRTPIARYEKDRLVLTY